MPQSKSQIPHLPNNKKNSNTTKDLFIEQAKVTKYLMQMEHSHPKHGFNKIKMSPPRDDGDGQGNVKFIDAQHLPLTQKDLQNKYTFKKVAGLQRRRLPQHVSYEAKYDLIDISSHDSDEEDGTMKRKSD